jgi:thioredoxin-related protein
MKMYLALLLFLGGLPFSNAQQWETDFDRAKALAAEKDLPIVLVFQGSDWCAPCIRLDREVWATETFRNYATSHFVMLKADFPRRKQNALPPAQAEANARLAELYNKNGIFPMVVVLDAQGKVKGRAGYERLSPEDYIQLLESFSHS